MTRYAVDRKQFAIIKESVRGTAEAAPDVFLKVGRDSALDFTLEHVENDRIQQQVEGEFAPEAGRKSGAGSVNFDLETEIVGYFLHSLLGSVSSAQIAATTAYDHTFTKTTSTQHQAYTLFMDRGIDEYKYAMGIVKSLNFEGDSAGKVIVTAEMLFQNEETAATFAPTIAAPDPMMFYETVVEIDDSDSSAKIGKWNLLIDNEAEPVWTLDGNQIANEIPVTGKLKAEGGFDIYFENVQERTDFLANTSRKLEFIMTGATIEGANARKLTITLYAVKYTAVPFDGELEGKLLGTSLTFKGFYSVSDTKMLQADLVSTITAF